VTDLDAIFQAIRERVADTPPHSAESASLLAHLHSLARWGHEPLDYPELGPAPFPTSLAVAYAVCHPECGAREFIVDGSTQECQRCGGLLFRTETREYELRPLAT
jgi:hypothetical protein